MADDSTPSDLLGWSRSTLADAALYYAARGWPVIPLKAGTKLPATRHGVGDATTDVDKVRRWWTKRPTCNIGISTVGMCVIDIDAPADEPGAGWSAWCALVNRHERAWPATWEVSTPSGGAHLYFAADGVRNSASKVARAVDVRGDGGYVVAPPSTTQAGEYLVVSDAEPAALPPWLAGLVTHVEPMPTTPLARDDEIFTGLSKYGATALVDEVAEVIKSHVGTRNDRLHLAAYNLGQLTASGDLSGDEVEAALLRAAETVGLPAAEAARTIRSGMTAGMRNPRPQRMG